MPEIIDNLSQLFVMLLGCIFSGIFYLKDRKQPYFILFCFYGCFALAGLYWLFYAILITDTSPIFYVSDIGWIAGFLFLLLLQDSLTLTEERSFQCWSMWLAPLTVVPLTIYYMSIGNAVYNLVTGCMMLLFLRRSLRGFIFWKQQPGQNRKQIFFHLTAIIFVILENCLWLSSYPWLGDG